MGLVSVKQPECPAPTITIEVDIDTALELAGLIGNVIAASVGDGLYWSLGDVLEDELGAAYTQTDAYKRGLAFRVDTSEDGTV